MVFSENSKLFSTFGFINKKGQTTVETLIILSMALTILIIFLGLVFNQVELQQTLEQQKLGSVAVKSLVEEINDAYFLGPGTVKTVTIYFPESTNFRKSYIYGNDLLLNVSGTDFAESTNATVKGNWPELSGYYTFKIIVFKEFVSLNIDSLSFTPEKIQESLLQGTSKDLNLMITNVSSSVKNYSFDVSFVGNEKATVTSVYDNFTISLSPNDTNTIPLTLSCLSDSAGEYVGELSFVSDIRVIFPVIINCQSAQEKLRIFPNEETINVFEDVADSYTFLVCNNSSNDLTVNPVVLGDLKEIVFTEKNLFVEKNSCSNLEVDILAQDSGSFEGEIQIFSSGLTALTNVTVDVS